MGSVGRGISASKGPEAETSGACWRGETKEVGGLQEMWAERQTSQPVQALAIMVRIMESILRAVGLGQGDKMIQVIFQKAAVVTGYQIAWEREWVGRRSRSRGQRGVRGVKGATAGGWGLG